MDLGGVPSSKAPEATRENIVSADFYSRSNWRAKLFSLRSVADAIAFLGNVLKKAFL